jgi:hypothetical protein
MDRMSRNFRGRDAISDGAAAISACTDAILLSKVANSMFCVSAGNEVRTNLREQVEQTHNKQIAWLLHLLTQMVLTPLRCLNDRFALDNRTRPTQSGKNHLA